MTCDVNIIRRRWTVLHSEHHSTLNAVRHKTSVVTVGSVCHSWGPLELTLMLVIRFRIDS